jgi:hypothetical protein
VKTWKLIPVLFVMVPSGLSDDFKTIDGKEYKKATVSRVEPDGIVIVHSSGIVKIPFVELSAELQKKYGYQPEKAKAYADQVDAQQRALATEIQLSVARVKAEQARQLEAARTSAADSRDAAQRSVQRNDEQQLSPYQQYLLKEKREKQLSSIRIHAVIKPFRFEKEQTIAHVQAYEQYDTGRKHNPTNTSLEWAPIYDWRAVGKEFIGVIDEAMPDSYESGDKAVVALYKIGHTGDNSRDPLFTTNADKALRFLGQRN